MTISEKEKIGINAMTAEGSSQYLYSEYSV